MNARWIVMLLLSASCAGCLTGETTSTLYIERDHSVTWTILEHDVHSTAEDRAKQAYQEREYIRRVRRGEHDVKQGFELLAPDRIETEILRDEPPFAVATSAHFDSADRLAQTLLDVLEMPGFAYLEETADRVRLVVQIEVPHGETEAEEPEREIDEAPGEGFFDFEIALAQGRFVETVGFVAIEEDRVRLADGDELERMAAEAEGPLVLTLAWSID